MAIYWGTNWSLFLLRSIDFRFCKSRRHVGNYVTILFFILKTWMSAKATIPGGMDGISLLETSILTIGLHYHQFWSSIFNSSILQIWSGNTLASCPTKLNVPLYRALLIADTKDFFSIIARRYFFKFWIILTFFCIYLNTHNFSILIK